MSANALSVAEVIARAETYEPPATLPPGDDAAAEVLYRLCDVWALQLATGEITVDGAYALAKGAAQSLEVHTRGRRRWKATKPFMEWLVEASAARMAAHFAVMDDAALRDLKRVGLTALSQGGGEAQVRSAIALAASGMAAAPPVEILHAAYHDAVAEARRNARWMMQRAASA